MATTRISLLGLTILVGCSTDPSGADQPGPAPAPDTSVDAGPAAEPTTRGTCGLEYQWLPRSAVGEVVASNSHELTPQSQMIAVKTALWLNNVPWYRSIDYGTQLHEYRYTTQDRGEIVEATGYVIAPVTESPEKFPVLLFLHGTTGLSDACAPSANLDDASSDNYLYSRILSLLAANGYIVVAPDYVGIAASGAPSTELHPYLVGESVALSSWDAVRAAEVVLDDAGAGVELGPVAVWGASQGGHAAAFTTRYAPSYAPELDVVAGVYNVPPLDLATHWQKALESPRAATGFIIMAFVGMAEYYGADLTKVFVAPFDSALPADLRENCRPSILSGLTSLADLFTGELLTANAQPLLGGDFEPWSCAIRENTLATTSIERSDAIPSLVLTGEIDTLVETAVERDNFAQLCASGDYAQWRYLECEGAGHAEGFLWAIDDALDWIDDRVAGVPLPGSCEVTAPVQCQNTPL